MTTIEEDLLLNSDGEMFDSMVAIDEDALLGDDDGISRKSIIDSNDFDQHSKQKDSTPIFDKKEDEKKEDDETSIYNEDLDYDEDDEDEEKRERTSRYASEKRKESEVPEFKDDEDDGNDDDDKKSKNEASKASNSMKSNKSSSFPKTNHQPIAVRLKLDDGPEQIFLPRPSYQPFNPTPIVPRLPNGIPLVSLPSNHGHAGFGNNYPPSSRMSGGGGGAPMAPLSGDQWDQAVSMFLNGISTKSVYDRSRKRSSSYSSYSSYSTRSSSSSRSRSRSRSRSDRKRKDRKGRRHHESRGRYDKKRSDYKRSDHHERKRREQRKSTTIESAKALGLSDEYLKKMKDQQQKRDEILKKKEERRHGRDRLEKKKSEKNEEKSEKTSKAASSSEVSEREKKMKAYLVVNVHGLKQLSTALKRVETMATELGPIKKCWKHSDDAVSIIFNTHDKAKDFMLKYNNKILSGLRINVTLEKKFLNLSEMS